ncbi:hypothetical protein C8R43DRAFT_840170, partial [Mycena crocata]
YLVYSTPHPSTRYSATYFSGVTFKEAAELEYPTICAPKTISAWTFADETPNDVDSEVEPHETIPHIDDLLPILRDMEEAFGQGARSVAVSLILAGKTVDRLYHLSKLRCFTQLNNNKIVFQAARALVNHLSATPLISASILERFLSLPIRSPIFGFCVTDFPLWKLSCLLGEEWLHEDVLNAVAELLYFTQAVASPYGTPSTLILATHFLNDAKYLFAQSPRFFSPNLIAIRRRLEQTVVEQIFSFSCALNHHSVYNATDSTKLRFGDSLNVNSDTGVLPVLQWVLGGTGFTVPVSVAASTVLRQGPGSGSCGVAALNFVERKLDPEVGTWSTEMSPFFRNRALRDLILYHVTASTQSGDEVSWTLFNLSEESTMEGPVGYNDFNLDAPNVRFNSGVELCSFSLHLNSGLPSNSPLFADITGARRAFLRLGRPTNTYPARITSIRASPLALLPPFSQLPRLHPSQIVLDIAATPEPADLDAGVIDLCTPSPVHKAGAAVKTERMDSIIDLTLSPGEQRPFRPLPRRRLTFAAVKSDPDIIIVDSSVTAPPRVRTVKAGSEDPPQNSVTPRSLPTVDVVRLGSFFTTFELGQAAVYALQAQQGHIWRVGQTKRANDGSVRRISLRCNHYGQPNAVHREDIDPSDHRAGRTIRTNCTVHVNLAAVAGGGWHVTIVDWEHNHPPQVPVGGHIPRPPTEDQRNLVSEFASTGNFTRTHLTHILRARFPDNVLEPRQVSNLINAARKEANEVYLALGGDMPSVLAKLRELRELDPRWDWDVKLDEHQVVIALWWQSPNQAVLARRFYDILINDNTYCRNQYGYPLNIGIVIDNFGSTRNCWYAVHRSEDTETHNWVFKNHLRSAGRPPEVLASDRHPSLIASSGDVLPLSFHLYCLHHLGGNVATQLRPVLRGDWDDFNRDFWAVY